jgi:predicted Kef-type K+ transport protein
MHHEIALIPTIAIGLVYPLIGGYIVSRVGLPPLVGYLLTGVAEGPFTPGFVGDAKLAPQLAEIGIILLMFGAACTFQSVTLQRRVQTAYDFVEKSRIGLRFTFKNPIRKWLSLRFN